MPAQYLPPGELPNENGNDPFLQALQQIEGSDISPFSALANEAARTRTKSAGRDLINRRNNLLSTFNPYQRAKVGRTYYNQLDRPGGDAFGAFNGQSQDFINLISQGDDSFLQGLADDPGTGGTGNGTGSGGGGSNGGNLGNMGGIDLGGLDSRIQDLIRTLQNQNNGNAGVGTGNALSSGSVSNMAGTAAGRAQQRQRGIASTLAQRSRGRRSSGVGRRYF